MQSECCHAYLIIIISAPLQYGTYSLSFQQMLCELRYDFDITIHPVAAIDKTEQPTTKTERKILAKCRKVNL